MASGTKSAMKKQYKSTKNPQTEELDISRFHSSDCEELYYQIVPQEHVMYCYYFNFASLDRVGLKIRDFLVKLGISKFVEMKGLIYPNWMREFYANLHVGTHSSSKSSVVFSLVLLDNEDDSRVSDIDIGEFLSSKAVIDITDDVFENNDFGVEIRMILVALTWCLMLKIKTQHKLVRCGVIFKNQILRKLKHENIISMMDSFESLQEFCVGELFEILEDDTCLPEEQVQAISKQLVRALRYLQSNVIIHRDMKPQNILIGADLLLSYVILVLLLQCLQNTVVLRSMKGTPLYMALELVREQPYNHSADLGSLVVTPSVPK
ncbi:hypothetical protein OROHE_010064 [Orobanche hederae]